MSDIDALVASIEGDGFVAAQSKKSKNKKKPKAKAKPFVDESTPDVASSDDEDPMMRMVQAKQNASNAKKPGVTKPNSLPTAAVPVASESGNASAPLLASNGSSNQRNTKYEAKLALLQREYDTFCGSQSQKEKILTEDECIAHASYESALSQQLKDAQIAVDRERAKQASKAKTLSPSDLLGLTEASLLARANSDGNTEPGAHQRRALFAVKRGARPFEFTPGDGASAPLKSGDDVDDDDYIASGMNELGVEECAARPANRAEHERLLRTARKCAHADAAAAAAAAGGEAAGQEAGTEQVTAVGGGGYGPGVGDGSALEASLLAAFGHDPKFGFLKSYHPLHGYYCLLRCLALPHLDHLVALAEAEAAATLPSDFAAKVSAELAALPEDDDDARSQHLGQRLYPTVAALHPEHAPKLTGMLLALPRDTLLPMLTSDKSFKSIVNEALGTLLAAQNDNDVDGEEES